MPAVTGVATTGHAGANVDEQGLRLQRDAVPYFVGAGARQFRTGCRIADRARASDGAIDAKRRARDGDAAGDEREHGDAVRSGRVVVGGGAAGAGTGTVIVSLPVVTSNVFLRVESGPRLAMISCLPPGSIGIVLLAITAFSVEGGVDRAAPRRRSRGPCSEIGAPLRGELHEVRRAALLDHAAIETRPPSRSSRGAFQSRRHVAQRTCAVTRIRPRLKRSSAPFQSFASSRASPSSERARAPSRLPPPSRSDPPMPVPSSQHGAKHDRASKGRPTT